MKIIILGAGQVGWSVAENLASEANGITVIDTDGDLLKQLQAKLDLQIVVGNAASPEILRTAGAADADLLIAVTQSDQTNLCACRIAKSLFNLPVRIARLRSADYADYPELLDSNNFAVDFSICPEQIVTDYVRKLIEFPSALQVLEFAEGLVSLVAVRAYDGGMLVGQPLSELAAHLPGVDVRIAAIYRRGRPIEPEGNTVIEQGDEVFCLAATEHIRTVLRELRRLEQPIRKIMIAGGGNIGFRLARALQHTHSIKIIERYKSRAEFLASNLDNVLVLSGDGTDEDLLKAEYIEDIDMFLALTNDEEDNIMATLLAKRMGARRTVALINRKSYADLVQGGGIDIAISPAQASIGCLLAHVRQGDVEVVHSLRRGAAEALELVAHGDASTSQVVDRRIDAINLPAGVSIAAIVRDRGSRKLAQRGGLPVMVEDREVIMAHHDTVIRAGDHVIVFALNKRQVVAVEKLFQVAFGFL